MELLAAAAQHISVANGEQALAGNHVATAAERVSEGIGRMSLALSEQREGCRQIRLALVPVVDLPRSNRALALRINQGLRGINSDTELLEAEVSRFKVLPEESRGALRFGVVPLESPARMHRRFTPLAEHLGRALGRPVELKVALDFERGGARPRRGPDAIRLPDPLDLRPGPRTLRGDVARDGAAPRQALPARGDHLPARRQTPRARGAAGPLLRVRRRQLDLEPHRAARDAPRGGGRRRAAGVVRAPRAPRRRRRGRAAGRLRRRRGHGVGGGAVRGRRAR